MAIGSIEPISEPSARPAAELVRRVMTLLDAAIGELGGEGNPARLTVLQAASLLRRQIDPQAAAERTERRGLLLAWQVRKVREYIDEHLEGCIRVEDLCAVVRQSKSHFSRYFKRTFGTSPHLFVLQRRLELAARCLLETDDGLTDIALRCGFCDQAHLCRCFRNAMGETPAAWRRARRGEDRVLLGAVPDGRQVPDSGSNICRVH